MNAGQSITATSDIFIPEKAEEQALAKFGHIPALDGLRGIAVLLVMFYHTEFLTPTYYMLTKGGFLGVDIFFVLSGFLITSILLKEFGKTGQISLKRFYLRRLFRLIPAYWAFILFLYLFARNVLPDNQSAWLYEKNTFFYAFFYLTNWVSAMKGGVGNLNHTWSLAIEEQFYILWSLVLFALFRKKRTRQEIVTITAGIILSLIVWRMLRALLGSSFDALYYSTETRIDALLIGCLASMVYMWRLIPTNFIKAGHLDRLAFAASLTAIFIIFIFQHEDITLYYGVLSMFTGAVAIVVLWFTAKEHCFVHSLFEFKPLAWIGKISYSLYLWHYLCYEFSKMTFDALSTQLIFSIGLSFAMAAISYYLIEMPFLKLKEKFSS